MSKKKIKSAGVCYCCQRHISGSEGALSHLLKCPETFEFLTDTSLAETPQGCFIKVYDMNKPDAYWMILAIPRNFTLKQLDLFFRYLWCECCNHLSCFELISNEHSKGHTLPMMKTFVELSAAMTQEHKKLKFTYDYADSTYLIVEYLQDIPYYSKSATGSQDVFMIIRNCLPDFPCQFCSKEKGKFYCFGCQQYFGLKCHDLKKRHQCEDPSVVSVVNSPRFGCCCYQGSQYAEEQSEFTVPLIADPPPSSSSASSTGGGGSSTTFPANNSSGVEQVQSRTTSLGERRSSASAAASLEFRSFSTFETLRKNNTTTSSTGEGEERESEHSSSSRQSMDKKRQKTIWTLYL